MNKRCIFCKHDCSTSKSVEHILPESLGNTEHILPPGTVCDSCNNYFAGNIERPVLESGYFAMARFNLLIPNKRERMPVLPGMLLPVRRREGELRAFRADVTRNRGGDLYMYAEDEAEEGHCVGPDHESNHPYIRRETGSRIVWTFPGEDSSRMHGPSNA